MSAVRLTPLLALALAALVTGVVEGAPVKVPAGRKWIKLVGRDACRGSSGWLGPDLCGGSHGNSLMLKMVGGGPWTTWRMNPVDHCDYELGDGAALTLQIEGRTKPLPKCGNSLNAPNCPSFLGAAAGCANTALSMIASATTNAQFALEKVNGTTDQYYIRTNGRGSCPKRYLGAVYKANVRGCGGDAQLGLHAKDAANIHTRWQVIPVPALPSCPAPPSPPSPSPPPPNPSPPPPACKQIDEPCITDTDCCDFGSGAGCSFGESLCKWL